MWQRFTERARKVVFYAQEEAQRFGEGFVSTEHLLLGLLREKDCVAFKVLESFLPQPTDIKERIERMMPRGDPRPSQDMTLTPRAKRVIDLSYSEARELDNNYIGTEHLLLGLIREGDGLAGRVLSDYSIKLDAAREVVRNLQQERWDKQPIVPSGSQPQYEKEDLTGKLWRLLDNAAKEALFYAQEESQCFEDRCIGPEQILLGVFYERRNRASLCFRRIGIDPELVIQTLEKSLTRTERGDSLDLVFTEAARRVIENALVEADAQAQPLAGPDHLVLGILCEPETLAAKVLAEVGDVEKIRSSLTRVARRVMQNPMRYSIARSIGMWDKLSDELKLAMHDADREAESRGEGQISSEHLLLGILRESDGSPQNILGKLGIDPQALIEDIRGRLKPVSHRADDRVMSGAAIGILGVALSYARSFNREKVAPEDLLLAIIHERYGIGGQALAQFGVTLDATIQAVKEMENG